VSLEPVRTTAAVDVAHRALISRLRQKADAFEIDEILVRLVGGLVHGPSADRRVARRAATQAAHARIVDYATEAIAADPAGIDLRRLAADLGYSRYHLSRVFSAVTGRTLTEHRNRVRICRVLDRLADGERSLAALAADLGFADQSHMVRVLKGATGSHAMGLRRWLRSSAGQDHTPLLRTMERDPAALALT
jgi:AraC-like DNA-binding protein